MTTYQPLGIRPDAMSAWTELGHALDELADNRHPVVCTRYPDLFFSENRDDREQAAEMCSRCPVRQLCETFADANDERSGVWAGVDRTPRSGRPRAVKA